MPVVKIDNKSDAFATVVSIQFGDQLGELLDTVRKCIAPNTNFNWLHLGVLIALVAGSQDLPIVLPCLELGREERCKKSMRLLQ